MHNLLRIVLNLVSYKQALNLVRLLHKPFLGIVDFIDNPKMLQSVADVMLPTPELVVKELGLSCSIVHTFLPSTHSQQP